MSNVFPIHLPALRERLEDIPLLIEDIIARLKAEKRGVPRLTSDALLVLESYQWPGNVRELANVIERLAILYPGRVVDVPDLPEYLWKFSFHGIDAAGIESRPISVSAPIPHSFACLPEDGLDLREHLNNLEYELIRQALDRCNGVVAHAAHRLRLRRTTLVEKLRKFGLRGEETATLLERDRI